MAEEDTDLSVQFIQLTKEQLWRLEHLLEAGYSNSVALLLAVNRDVDLHLAEKAMGCGSELEACYLLGLIDTLEPEVWSPERIPAASR